MELYKRLLYVFLSLATHVASVYCAGSAPNTCTLISPIQIPIRNTTITDQISRRGIALQVGTPAQSIAFEAAGNWNNTYLCDSSSPCGGSDTPIKCAALCGGFLIESSSVSWSQAASFGALNTASEYFPDHAKDVPGNDTFHLNSTFSLPTFPFGISRLPAGSMNMIGLGTNSSLLNTLLSTGAIASRTWALFQGWTGAESEHQIDGSLVLGGYDTAKMTGSNTTIPFTQDQSCATHLVVVITDIKMNLKNGSNPSILGSSAGSAIKACIAPEFPIMSFSIDIWNSFKSVANVDDIGRSYGINFWGMIISANGSYDGDLTISLSTGLDITIPNHQLVVPDVGFSEQGQPVINNDTVTREVLINSLQDVNKNDMPLLGQTFLTSAYLLVDNDHSQFTLWRSNATTNQNLVAIGPSSCVSSTSVVPSPVISTPSLASPTSSSGNSGEPSRPVSKGAIAGGVVGGLALVAFAAVAIIFVFRRRATRVQEQISSSEGPDGKYPQGHEYRDAFNHGAEMASNENPAQEMPLTTDQDYILSPYEMPTTHQRQELSSG